MNSSQSFTLIIILLVPCFLSAQIVTDRPDQTESSSTIPKGQLQLESGFSVSFTSENNTSLRGIAIPSTLFRLGVTDWFELRFFNQFESIKSSAESKPVHGISDLEAGFKVELLGKDEINVEIAFLSHVIFPTGSKGISTKSFGVINKLALSHSLCESVGMGYNIGYNYLGEGRGDFTYSLAIGAGISEKLGIYLEPYGEVVNFDSIVADFDAGITYLVKENLQLDFSFGTGLNHRMNYLSLGFSWLSN